MPSHHTRKRPRTVETRDRRTSAHTFLSKLPISESQDQRHASFTNGVTRRQQRRIERKQKRKRKSGSFRAPRDDTGETEDAHQAKAASDSSALQAEPAHQKALKEANVHKRRRKETTHSSEIGDTSQSNATKSARRSGNQIRLSKTDSSPPPPEDPDTREIRRLERLLGVRGRKTTKKERDPYAALFDDTETDLLDLMKSCDDTLKRRSHSTQTSNGENGSRGNEISESGDSDMYDSSEPASDISLPAVDDDLESESKRSQGGDAEASSNESEDQVPYVAKWKKRDSRSSRGGSSAKALQGLLNRVSAGNAADMAARISELYANKDLSVAEKGKLLSSHVDVVLEAISQGNTMGTTNPYLYAHVKVLHIVGNAIDTTLLARFVVAAVQRLGSFLASESDFTLVENTTRKSQILGYVVALCAAYELGILSPGFICEVFSWIAESLCKTRVDAELKFVQEVGPLLRRRDPAVFVDLVKIVHRQAKHTGSDKTSDAFSDEISCKLSMLSDTVDNIRNNRMKTANNVAQAVEEPNDCLPFRVSLTQLLDDEFTKQKWWVDKDQNGLISKQSNGQQRETDEDLGGDQNWRISKLAAALRLHTDSRRSLLAAVVNSANCSDAFHRIERLGALTSRQRQKDLTYILTQCCGAEQPYNDFYALLGTRVCNKSREARFAMGYTIQDAIKGSGCYDSRANLSRKGENIGRYLGDLWASDSLPLSMLRRVPDLEDAGEGERNFYIAALQRMISQRIVTKKDPITPFTKLKQESEGEEKLFCTSLSVFLMRHAKPKMSKKLQSVLSKIIDELENTEETHKAR